MDGVCNAFSRFFSNTELLGATISDRQRAEGSIMNRISLASAAVLLAAPAAIAQSGLRGLKPLPPPDGGVTPAQQAVIDAKLAEYEAAFGPISHGGPRAAPPKLTFFPSAGTLYADLWLGNFVDLDPNAGAVDFRCGDLAGDGHLGHDAGPPWFGEQIVGVPIFAALDGVVTVALDGEDDMNTNGAPTPGNLVFIDHGDGFTTSYWHMKKNSVLVNVGDPVVAGQQIGQQGSSGNSFGPHVHFELDQNGVIYEPFTGACNPGASGWTTQPTIPTAHYAWDFGFWHDDLGLNPWWPNTWPREGQIAITDDFMEFWLLGNLLPANTNWRVRFQRPDGVITFDSGVVPWGNPDAYGWYLTWWRYYLVDIPDIQTTPGTWRVLIDVDGVTAVDAPVEMRPARTSGFNRAPEPVTAAIEPNQPKTGDVLVCRVSANGVVDDRDYDIVRYRYLWRVNGAVARDVTSAARSDALPRTAAAACGVVTCDVTPGDGLLDAATVVASVVVAPACRSDFDGDGAADLTDLAILLANFDATSAAHADGDTDCDGDVDLTDLATLLSDFEQPC
ncbi:MAG: hypothetical protein D6744_03035 [Planctomycetota bacterium]|nr:MAG: hypothetical protein D6744_03035 [Planctomycetota bacterium]